MAPLGRLARWCLPLVAPGGELVAMKGSSAPAEVVEAGPELRKLGCATPVVVELGSGTLEQPTWVVRVARPESGPVGWRGRPGSDRRTSGSRTDKRTRQQRRGV